LLILDNAVDNDLVADLLSYRPSIVQAIITTRNQIAFSDYEQVKLADFNPEEGMEYIKTCFKATNRKLNDQVITSLIQEVGLIPQKLALAVGYLSQRKLVTVQMYTNKIQELKKLGKKQQDFYGKSKII
jgi:hypothetical protein